MRKKEIDLARGFTVFIMTPVHAVLIYSTPEVYHSWLGHLLAFLAEGPGAPLFMTVMGISFVFSRDNQLSNILRKSLILLVLACLLNFLKFIVPLYFGIIPLQLLIDHGISAGSAAYSKLFLIGDILQLAAISLIFLALLYTRRYYWIWCIITAPVVIFASPFLWGRMSSIPVLNYIFNLLWTNSTNVYFPVFPWMAYPLTGLCIGHFIKLKKNPYPLFGIAGIVIMAAGWVLSLCYPGYTGNFYLPGPGQVVYNIGFVMLWLYGCYLIIKYVPENAFFRLLFWLSRHITLIYFLQWIIIFWSVPFFGYRDLDLIASLKCIFLLTPAVFGITYLINKYRQRIQKNVYEPSHL